MTMTARSRRASLTGATLAVAAVLAAGCSSASSSSSSPSSPATTGASATASATAAAASASASAGAGGTGSAAACTTADLKATTGNAGGGTAGSYYSFVDFTNTSNASCTLYGYPGVSLITAAGAQIGPAATRSTTTAPRVVTLTPGGTANAVLRMTDPSVYSTQQCQPATSAYLKIYPPNQTQPVQISFNENTCASSAINMLQIGAVTSGTT
jgi:hypothetical protein